MFLAHYFKSEKAENTISGEAIFEFFKAEIVHIHVI